MQALADEAGVSVGLIYRYFGNKEDVLLAVILDVLEAFRERVPAAAEQAGGDPVEQLAAAFRAYCEVTDSRRYAALLTYRESKTLSEASLDRIKELEQESTRPLRDAIRAGVRSGILANVDAELLAYDFVLLAHGWALKYWFFAQRLDFEEFVAVQTAFALRSVIAPEHRQRYQHLLAGLSTVDEDGWSA